VNIINPKINNQDDDIENKVNINEFENKKRKVNTIDKETKKIKKI
jgi:hypothetical protein